MNTPTKAKEPVQAKPTRSIFVIMPFTQTPTRTKPALDDFFGNILKAAIEDYSGFRYRYIVSRSSDEYSIDEAIIRNLFEADLVLCDLSGEFGNSNVLFELGIRLSVCTAPVIMFREHCENNRPIFDVATFYAEPYDTTNYRPLQEFIIRKMKEYEEKNFVFESPILSVLGGTPRVIALLSKASHYRKLQLLNFAANLQFATYCGDVMAFLLANDLNDFPKQSGFFFHWLTENFKSPSLSSLAWDSFTFANKPSPILDRFLVDPTIDGTLPGSIGETFLFYFVHFYEMCATNRAQSGEPSLARVLFQLREWYILNQIVISMLVLSGSKDETDQKIGKTKFDQYFNESAFANDVRESIGIAQLEPGLDAADTHRKFPNIVIQRNS